MIWKNMLVLVNWFEDNKLIINKGKTIAMSFHHVQNKYPEKPVIKYESTIIPYSSSVKFLGVWMDENLKWSVHLHNLEMKLSKICIADISKSIVS